MKTYPSTDWNIMFTRTLLVLVALAIGTVISGRVAKKYNLLEK